MTDFDTEWSAYCRERRAELANLSETSMDPAAVLASVASREEQQARVAEQTAWWAAAASLAAAVVLSFALWPSDSTVAGSLAARAAEPVSLADVWLPGDMP